MLPPVRQRCKTAVRRRRRLTAWAAPRLGGKAACGLYCRVFRRCRREWSGAL